MWGWGNSQGENDWYTLSSPNPRSYDSFTSNQVAIIGAEPILDACSGLSGSDIVCSSNVSYSVTVPNLASVVWSKSGNLTQVGGNTGSTYTVTKGSSSGGSGSIVATIKNSQGQTFITRTKNVWAGTPDHDNIMITGDDWVVPKNSIFMATASENMYIDYYQWDLPYGFTITQGQGTYTIRFNAPSGFGSDYYGLQLQNTCGTIGRNYVMYEAPFKAALKITPNPTAGETTLTIETSSAEKAFDETARWDLEVYSESQLLKTRQTGLRGQSAKIQTTGWQEGVYLVRVNYKGEILTGKLLVKN